MIHDLKMSKKYCLYKEPYGWHKCLQETSKNGWCVCSRLQKRLDREGELGHNLRLPECKAEKKKEADNAEN